ncbi:unnamed protein product [Linum trigynum]|uniref:CCHC-type domain-containing protein n=1 Tax=Linum trigynum TaxID=586398 RepID=A0AAV2ET48_9ROSI
MSTAGPGASPSVPRPHESVAGSRRPPSATSSPNGKSDKESQQATKRPKSMSENPLFQASPMVKDVANHATQSMAQGEDSQPPNPEKQWRSTAWTSGPRNLFSEVLAEDVWYIVDSDSEDVTAAMKEDDVDDEVPEDDDPRCPTIPFKAMEKQRYHRKWRSDLIVKALGRTFPFQVVSRRLESLWAKCGTLQISSLSWGFYVVRFTTQMDYEQATAGGPLMIGGHYLTVRPWRKGLNPRTGEVASTMVWVRLPGLPIEFINREAVERIASRIGRPIKVDNATQNGDMGRFARVCVEVDLTKPLLSQFKIERSTYYIEFEGLHQICTECGRNGHTTKTCPNLFKPSKKEPVEKEKEEVATAVQHPPNFYGEWMIAKPRSRKKASKRDVAPNTGQSQPPSSTTLASGSRFVVLVDEEEEESITPATEPITQNDQQVEVLMVGARVTELEPRSSASNEATVGTTTEVTHVATTFPAVFKAQAPSKLVAAPVIQEASLTKGMANNGAKHNKGHGKKKSG